jgi:hypothetical protein
MMGKKGKNLAVSRSACVFVYVYLYAYMHYLDDMAILSCSFFFFIA